MKNIVLGIVGPDIFDNKEVANMTSFILMNKFNCSFGDFIKYKKNNFDFKNIYDFEKYIIQVTSIVYNVPEEYLTDANFRYNYYYYKKGMAILPEEDVELGVKTNKLKIAEHTNEFSSLKRGSKYVIKLNDLINSVYDNLQRLNVDAFTGKNLYDIKDMLNYYNFVICTNVNYENQRAVINKFPYGEFIKVLSPKNKNCKLKSIKLYGRFINEQINSENINSAITLTYNKTQLTTIFYSLYKQLNKLKEEFEIKGL